MFSIRFLFFAILLSMAIASFDTSLKAKQLSDLSFGLSWEHIDNYDDSTIYTIERKGNGEYAAFYTTKDTFAELFLLSAQIYDFRVCVCSSIPSTDDCCSENVIFETQRSDSYTFVPVDSGHIMVSWDPTLFLDTVDISVFRDGLWGPIYSTVDVASTSLLSVTSGRPDLYRISSGGSRSAGQFYTPPSTVYGSNLPGINVVSYEGSYNQFQRNENEISMFPLLSPTASLVISFPTFDPESLPCGIYSARLVVHPHTTTNTANGGGFIRTFGDFRAKQTDQTTTPVDPNFYLSSLSTQFDSNLDFINIDLDHVISGVNATATIQDWASTRDAELLLQLTETEGRLELTSDVTLEVAYEIIYPESDTLDISDISPVVGAEICSFVFPPQEADLLVSSVVVTLTYAAPVVSTYITVGIGSFAVGDQLVNGLEKVTFTSPSYPLQTGGFFISSSDDNIIYVNSISASCPSEVEVTLHSIEVSEDNECARDPDPSTSSTPSATPTASPSFSRTSAASTSPSPSASISISESSTASPSSTPSRSPSTSISNVISKSNSPSLTPTRTPTSSISNSPSATSTSADSATPTPSTSKSATPSRPGSTTPSNSPISSLNILPPITLPFASTSTSPIPSSSISMAPSFVFTRSPSSSPTPSASGFAPIVPTVVPLAKNPVSFPNGDGEIVVSVELGPQTSEGEVLLVAPVDASTVPDLATVRSAIVSLILNDEFGNELQPEGSVELCFASTEDTSKQCLGFLDETVTPVRWRCQDPCLETNSEGLVCGTTDHFTSFALLLNGGAGKGCGTSNDYIFDEFYQDTILITSFAAFVLCLAILVLLFLALTPCGSRIVKGKEGHRIWKLRQSTLIVTHDHITPPQDVDLEV